VPCQPTGRGFGCHSRRDVQGDDHLLLDSENTYWKLASSMGGFPIKHFYKDGVSLRPGSGAEMLRRVEDGVGAEAGAVYGRGLATADVQYRRQTWLSRRIARIKVTCTCCSYVATALF